MSERNKQADDPWVCARCGGVYLNHRMAAFNRTHCQYCGKQSVPIPRSTRDAIRAEGAREERDSWWRWLTRMNIERDEESEADDDQP